MKRVRRLTSLWNWLPVFRVVAETQHLPTASDTLRVSPSALSRTIGLIEQDVGAPLFDRVGRSLVLNPTGQRFLGYVRDAMRLVDDGLSVVAGREHAGPVVISVPAPFAPLCVLPALRELAQAYPQLEPLLRSVPSAQASSLLRRGVIDAALLDDPVPDPEVTIVPLGRITHGVYCGATHPLHRRRRVTTEQILEHPFVTGPADAQGRDPDPWPPELIRRMSMRTERMQVAIEACAAGDALCLLPDAIARRRGLRRLPVELADPTTLYVAHRPSLPVSGRTEIVVDAIKAAARESLDSSGP